MAQITFGGNPVHTEGELPAVGAKAPSFRTTKSDLSDITLEDFAGNKVVLNIFPSIGTGVCAASVRKFNQEAANLDNTVILSVSRDLPFAHKHFCEAEGIENVIPTSEYKDESFSKAYHVRLKDGPFEGLLSRAVVVIDEGGTVVYTEQVAEIGQEPDYEKALQALKG
jgi:thiol peroxidase